MSLHIGLPPRYTSARTDTANKHAAGKYTHTGQAKKIPNTHTESDWTEGIFSLAIHMQSHMQQEMHMMAVNKYVAYFDML